MRRLQLRKMLSVPREREEVLVLIGAAVYGVVFSLITIVRMYALQAASWDLGNYNQAFYTTLFSGKLLYSTADLPANPTGSLFGIHFSPSLLALLPLYAIFPRPETLLVIQSFALSAGSLPTYWLARDVLRSKAWGEAFAIAYLLNPTLWGINWFDFHPECLLPVSLLLLMHFYNHGQGRKLLVAIPFTLGIIEVAPILVFLLSLYFIYQSRTKLLKFRELPRKETDLAFLPILVTFASILWYFAAILTIRYLNPENPLLLGKISFWQSLGASNILQIPAAAIRNPLLALQVFGNNWANKALYLAVSFGSFGFLSIFSPIAMLLTLPWLTLSMLSDNSTFYSVGLQYPAYLLPFVIMSSIYGLRNLLRLKLPHQSLPEISIILRLTRKDSKSERRELVLPSGLLNIFKGRFGKIWLIVFALLFLIASNPMMSLNVANAGPPWTGSGIPSITPHDAAVLRLVHMIPPSASVLAEQHIFPLLSSRPNAFTPPTAAFMPPGTSFFVKLDELIQSSQYIILDFLREPASSALVLSKTYGKYGLLASADGIVLLASNYAGAQQFFQPYQRIFGFKDVTVRSGRVLADPASWSGLVTMRAASDPTNGDFWWGPYALLPPGDYTVSYRLKITNYTTQYLLTTNVNVFGIVLTLNPVGDLSTGYLANFTYSTSSLLKQNLASLKLTGDMLQPKLYADVAINFTANVFGVYEFPGVNATTHQEIYLDRISVKQTRAVGFVKPFEIFFGTNPVSAYSASSAEPYTVPANSVPTLSASIDQGILTSSFVSLVYETQFSREFALPILFIDGFRRTSSLI